MTLSCSGTRPLRLTLSGIVTGVMCLVLAVSCERGSSRRPADAESAPEGESSARVAADESNVMEASEGSKREIAGEGDAVEELNLSDEEWRRKLDPEEYYVLRQKGTERAFTGKYWKTKSPGTYVCAGCANPLFDAETKFESGTGWPSFWKPVSEESVDKEADDSFFMRRTEVLCSRCGGHLGHVFEDGPAPTYLRYCINSAALDLVEKDEAKQKDTD